MRWVAFVLILVFASDAFAQGTVVLGPGSVVGNSFAPPNFGAAFPSSGVALGFKNVGGNMDYAVVDPSHNVDVNCITGCSASAGASTVTVTGVTTVAPATGLVFPVQGVPNGVGIGVYPASSPLAPSLALESGNLLSIANSVTGISATFGSPFPSVGRALGFKNAGGNLDYAAVDASHNVDVNCITGCVAAAAATTVTIAGIATVAPAGGVFPVQGILNGVGIGVYPAQSPLAPSLALENGHLLSISNSVAGISAIFGAAFPSVGVSIGFKNAGGNMDYAAVDASHNVDVNCITGCVAAAAASTVTVSGVTTVAPVGGIFPVQGVLNGVGIGVYPARSPLAPSLALESGNLQSIANSVAGTLKVNCIVGCPAAGSSAVTVTGITTVAPAVGLGGTFPVQGVLNGVGIGVYPARFPLAPSLALESGNLLSIANAVAGISGCAGQSVANTKVAVINLASTTAAQLVSLAQGKQVYICALDLVSATAQNVALIEGTQVTNPCDTGTAGMAGGTTGSAGWNLAANGGLTKGNGQGIVYKTATLGHQVCLLSSSTGQISGEITYAQF